MQCAVCGAAAERKCTRCGQLFCGLHVRHGNPHFAFPAVRASVGHYCDACWQSYANLSARRTRWGNTGFYVALVLFGLFMCFVVGSMALNYWRFLQLP